MYFVDNLLANVEETLAVATPESGDKFPARSVISMEPNEVIIKHYEGWNPASNDWEFSSWRFLIKVPLSLRVVGWKSPIGLVHAWVVMHWHDLNGIWSAVKILVVRQFHLAVNRFTLYNNRTHAAIVKTEGGLKR